MGLVFALAGCGKKSDLVAVTGTVSYDGQPLKKGTMLFEPSEGRMARADIVEGAIVNVTTQQNGDGAHPGLHKVAIFSWTREPVGMETPPSVIPRIYNSPETSGLTAEISAPGPNELKFELTKAKKK